MSTTVVSLHLTKAQQHLLVGDAERAWPNEACAVLLGTAEQGQARVVKVILAENADHSPVTFRIAPQLLVKIYLEAEEGQLEVVGIFHSHPAPPMPSATDLEYMRVNPVVWVILSMPSQVLRAFQLDQGKLLEVALILT